HEDRRPVFANVAEGRDAMVGEFRTLANLGTVRVGMTLLATRGERLALFRAHPQGPLVGSTAFEAEWLVVVESDERRLVSSAIFDVDDLDGAIDELDERYIAGEGARGADALRVMKRFRQLYNERDWDGIRALSADDFVVVDYRRVATLGTMDSDGFVAALRELVSLIPGRKAVMTAVVALSPTAVVMRAEFVGATADGALIEETFHPVFVVREGKLRRHEVHGEDGLQSALASFKALEAHTYQVENAASGAVKKGQACVVRGDWSGLADLIAEDAEFVDARPGLRNVVRGRDAVVENFKAVAAIGVDRMEYSTVAVRGERLSLGREVIGSTDPDVPYDAELLSLHELDEDGRVCNQVLFAAGDLD
ncbi:MAG: nuclear transport factor 2 family protein, partial [Candidatus Binatia bacterium]